MAYTDVEQQVLEAVDPATIGWWIESVDERVYGPVSRKTLRQFLEQGVITPNTLVRHCTQTQSEPIADQVGLAADLKTNSGMIAGDRVGEVWPRKWRDQLALAEDSLPCARHKRPAVAICLRCHAPNCYKCRVKPLRRRFFFCRKCQSNHHNRRFLALMVDSLLFQFMLPCIGIWGAVAMRAEGLGLAIQVGGTTLFLLRDAMFRGAGPGKRMCGLHVVTSRDGITPLGYGQGIVRWLSQFIPIFNLVDAFAPLSDPFLRRYGDRWASTRVIDTASKLEKDRRSMRRKLAAKQFTLASEPQLSMEQFARLA
jgi:uncharacterized RDD family membrane protein YckC